MYLDTPKSTTIHQFLWTRRQFRKELVKLARKNAEECKIAIRHARRDANEMLDTFKDDGDIPEDDAIRGKKHVQELTDKGIKKVDEIVAAKEEDIMEI